MIANPAIPSPVGIPQSFALNDLRVQNTVAEETSSTSPLALSGMVLGVVLAIAAFIWLDPLHLFTPTEASPPASLVVPQAAPAQPTERQEIIAPLTPAPAAKSVEVPIAAAPAVRVPTVPATAVRPRAASVQASKKESTAPPVLLTNPEEKTAPPALLSKPEEKIDTPIVPKLADDAKTAPKPAATSDPAPATTSGPAPATE